MYAEEFPLDDSKRLCVHLLEVALAQLPEGGDTLLGVFDLRGFRNRNADLGFVRFLVRPCPNTVVWRIVESQRRASTIIFGYQLHCNTGGYLFYLLSKAAWSGPVCRCPLAVSAGVGSSEALAQEVLCPRSVRRP